MPHTNDWDENNPTNSTNAVDIDDEIKKVRIDVRERLAIDHDFDASDTGQSVGVGTIGQHEQITFKAPRATPDLDANQGMLYTKDVSAKAELHYCDEDDQEVQLTTVGKIAGTNLSNTETTITDDDAKIPTSGAVVDYVATLPWAMFGKLSKASPTIGTSLGTVTFDTELDPDNICTTTAITPTEAGVYLVSAHLTVTQGSTSSSKDVAIQIKQASTIIAKAGGVAASHGGNEWFTASASTIVETAGSDAFTLEAKTDVSSKVEAQLMVIKIAPPTS